jgi:2-keto-4-pentenoate hydratase/2-oxohepta-3-ene-1,7-dioic acid hydratase in catechol pathway
VRVVRFGPPGRERPGLLDAAGRVRDASALAADIDASLLASGLGVFRGVDIETLPLAPQDARLGPPVAHVGKFICVGLNYRDHAAESGMPAPQEPVIFLKATSAICGPNDDVIMPLGAAKLDWEVELGVIIGSEARYVTLEHALDHVAGLCVVHDVSERAFQLERGGQWDKGKGCDTFGPIGPALVTLDEIDDLGNLGLWCDVNGEPMQRGVTRDMIFDVPFLIHYISQFMSLQPGDVIATGTPAGVGLGRTPQRWLAEGDVVTLGVTGLGAQRQRIVRLDRAESATDPCD